MQYFNLISRYPLLPSKGSPFLRDRMRERIIFLSVQKTTMSSSYSFGSILEDWCGAHVVSIFLKGRTEIGIAFYFLVCTFDNIDSFHHECSFGSYAVPISRFGRLHQIEMCVTFYLQRYPKSCLILTLPSTRFWPLCCLKLYLIQRVIHDSS